MVPWESREKGLMQSINEVRIKAANAAVIADAISRGQTTGNPDWVNILRCVLWTLIFRFIIYAHKSKQVWVQVLLQIHQTR